MDPLQVALASFAMTESPHDVSRGPAAADSSLQPIATEDKVRTRRRARAILSRVHAVPGSTRYVDGMTVGRDLRMLTWLLCGGEDPDKVLPSLKAKDSKNCCKCTATWSGEHVAYRCHTCGIWSSSCMCVECFDIEEHQGHDFRMYSSSTGGCCDCGDPAAWKPEGFCKRHKAAAANAVDPVELLGPSIRAGAEAAIGVALTKLMPLWRRCSRLDEASYLSASLSASHCTAAAAYTRWVHNVASVCEGFRALVCEAHVSICLLYTSPSPRDRG